MNCFWFINTVEYNLIDVYIIYERNHSILSIIKIKLFKEIASDFKN